MSKFKLTQTAAEVQGILNNCNGLKSDAEGNLTASKNLGVDGKLTLKSLVSASNPDGDITKELGGGSGGGGSTEKLYKHTVYATSSDGRIGITFYNYNNVAINSEKKFKTLIQSIGEVIATGYIKNGSSVFHVDSVYFQSSKDLVYFSGYKIDTNSGEVVVSSYPINYRYSFTDNVSAVS